MSEEAMSGQESAAPTAPAETAVPVETTSTTTAPATETAAQDAFDNAEVQSFDREYVKKIRDEAARYRTEAKTYKEAFEGFDEGSQEVLINLVKTLKTDTKAGVEQMREIIKFLSPEEAAAVVEAVENAEETPEEELSVEERVERKLAERETQAKQQREIQGVIDQATELGFPPGDPDHITLLWVANNQTNNDLVAAKAILEDRNQKIIDKYIEAKQGTASAFTTPSAGATPPAGDATKAKGFGDSRSRLEARLSAMSTGNDA